MTIIVDSLACTSSIFTCRLLARVKCAVCKLSSWRHHDVITRYKVDLARKYSRFKKTFANTYRVSSYIKIFYFPTFKCLYQPAHVCQNPPSILKLHLQITSPNYISKLHVQIISPNYISKLRLQITSPNYIYKLHLQITSPNYISKLHLQITSPNYISKLHLQITSPNYISKLHV
jgi:hypothetical protein